MNLLAAQLYPQFSNILVSGEVFLILISHVYDCTWLALFLQFQLIDMSSL
jgi:hypothetical protein